MNQKILFSVSWGINLFLQRLLFIAFLTLSGSVLAISAENDLFIDTSSTQTELGSVNPEIVIRQRAVELSIEALSENNAVLQLNMFQDVEMIAVLDHIEEDDMANQAWIGTIEGIENSSVSLVMSKGKLSGSINLPDVCYHIRHIQNQLHVIREIDVAALQETLDDWDQELLTEFPGLQRYEQSQEQAFATSTEQVSGVLGPEEQQVLELVNQERAVRGLNLLAADELLTSAARGHSQDMSQNNYFSHTSPAGTSPGQRITASGYPSGAWGENIASGYPSATSVMNGWMNSTGHRDNILRASFCDIGIGYVAAGRYWTQDFGRKQGVSSCPSVDNPSDPNPPTTPDPTPPSDPNPPVTPGPASDLQNGAAINFSLAQNETIEFVVQVPENVSEFKVAINGSGDADLYVKKSAINWPADNGQNNSAEFKSPWVSGSDEAVSFNSPTKGTWHVLIHGYNASSGNITATWQTKNTDVSDDGTLVNGSEKNFSLSKHQILEYQIDLPASVTDLQVKISGTGDADLYVKRAPVNWPEDSGAKNQPEFKAPWASGSNESVVFSNPAQGTWHILLHGYQAGQGNISVSWQ